MSASNVFNRRAVLNVAAGIGLSLAALSPGVVLAQATTAQLLDKAIAGQQRSDANKARDVFRHPRETLEFFGLKPDQTVIEIAPGGGWYTEILAPVMHDRGRFYVAHFAPPSTPASVVEAQRGFRTRFEEKLKREPMYYDKVIVGTMPDAAFTDITPPGGADMVLTFRNIHNWIEDGNFDATLGAFFKVLKPGGVLGVEEHRGAPGMTVERMNATGYVPEAYVIEHARAAGFELAGRSEINANPRDTKDYANGVWALPPTYRGGDVDKAKFTAIGESDRMTLRFVKPAK
ncbi:class I SAM-dependent methyltransferase [soil metagenome]